MTDDLREKLAALEHEQWAHWTHYILDRVKAMWDLGEQDWDDQEANWRRQIETPYHDLPEGEKKSDREWADKVFELLKADAYPLWSLPPDQDLDLDDQLARPKRLAACKQWEWIPGMMLIWTGPGGYDRERHEEATGTPLDGWIPDLSDYATAAILLCMAMEAGYHFGTGRWGSAWSAYHCDDYGIRDGLLLHAPAAAGIGTVAAMALLELWEQGEETGDPDTGGYEDGDGSSDWLNK